MTVCRVCKNLSEDSVESCAEMDPSDPVSRDTPGNIAKTPSMNPRERLLALRKAYEEEKEQDKAYATIAMTRTPAETGFNPEELSQRKRDRIVALSKKAERRKLVFEIWAQQTNSNLRKLKRNGEDPAFLQEYFEYSIKMGKRDFGSCADLIHEAVLNERGRIEFERSTLYDRLWRSGLLG